MWQSQCKQTTVWEIERKNKWTKRIVVAYVDSRKSQWHHREKWKSKWIYVNRRLFSLRTKKKIHKFPANIPFQIWIGLEKQIKNTIDFMSSFQLLNFASLWRVYGEKNRFSQFMSIWFGLHSLTSVHDFHGLIGSL